MRNTKINPFGTVAKEEVVAADIQETKKKAITALASMEEKDIEVSQPMSSNDDKELWRNWREERRVRKEALLKQ